MEGNLELIHVSMEKEEKKTNSKVNGAVDN